MKPLVSIIIVYYHVKEELFACLNSIYNSKPETPFEIIVVDNDEIKTLKNDLIKKFSTVQYIPNHNKGFGQGNNTGAKKARGKYLFFLNPDTIVFKGALDELRTFLDTNKKAGVVAPFLLHENKKPFVQQGVKVLTPLRAIFSLSIINKFFPNNPVAKNYFIQWDKIDTKEVDVVPGTAFMISSDLYKTLKGFDEHFFLYFEEFDLCKRIKDKGYQLFITPKVKIIHLWERSTKQRNDINTIFNQSRYYYFKKHFGVVQALITNTVLNFGKYSALSLCILILGAFLRFYKLNSLMHFIGDQAWFYLSARDMLITGTIPLVGITSSHTWLHQGPIWTYILAVALFIGRFNPLSGGYIISFLDLLTVWVVYRVGSVMFSKRTGIIASLFYATSPLILNSARSPYHTSLIPLFTLLCMYVLYQWIHGFKYGFPLLLFILALLYNFELSMVMLIPIVCFIFLYGIYKKFNWALQTISIKFFVLSLIAVFIPMIPFLLYDVHHGYPQTIKFSIWIVYKLASFLHIPLRHPDIPGESIPSMFSFGTYLLSFLLFMENVFIAWFILIACTINLCILNYRQYKQKGLLQPHFLLLLFFIVPVAFYLAEKTNSDAYWLVFYPTIAIMIGLLVDSLLSFQKYFYLTIGLYILFIGINVCAYIYYEDVQVSQTITFTKRIAAAKQIIHDSGGLEYNLYGMGQGSQYASYTMNYQYLTWWLGHGPSNSKTHLHIYVTDQTPKIVIIKKEVK